MSRHFAALAYTPGVRACQRRYAGRELDEGTGNPAPRLGPDECAFIAARDSFYLSTVSASGWPHVQHRGGPAGFLRVLDPTTLAFADLSGNRQYVSLGNLGDNERAALLLIDYPNRRRLKILGRVAVIDLAPAADDGPAPAAGPGAGPVAVDAELLGKMAPLPATAERLLVIRVAAFDWNCGRHITPRFTASEWQTRCSSLPTEPSPSKE